MEKNWGRPEPHSQFRVVELVPVSIVNDFSTHTLERMMEAWLYWGIPIGLQREWLEEMGVNDPLTDKWLFWS